jgi:hypothetical protein
MDMIFGKCNIRSLHTAGYLLTVSKDLSRYRLDLLGGQEVRWKVSGIAPAGECTFYGSRIENHELGTGFLYKRESYQQ